MEVTIENSSHRFLSCLLLHVGCAVALFGTQVSGAEDIDSSSTERITFNKQVRPILSENCFHCHGPDEEGRAADLRLDDRDAAIDYGAIVPGKSNESLLIERINSVDPEMVMPPLKSHKRLTDKQKRILATWIAQGAQYERHWAFEPITVVAPEQSIDDFIDAKLAEKKLSVAAPAPRQRWLRRVTLDLTGLPPTVTEINRFLADQSPEAYERVVDRLLASSAYGERMAAEWLDVARYSDTYGYQVDRNRFVWPWRDWVIRTFNDNLPYDDFIIQQLAGDLLPNASDEQILATTFNRLHPQKVEGGSVEEEFRVEYVVDRAQTVSTAFMGLTFECARCHDHKFDPLTQKEFYELNAFFANINEAGLYSYHTDSTPTPTLQLPTDDQRTQLALAEQNVAAAERKFEQSRKLAAGAVSTTAAPLATLSGPIASQGFDARDTEKIRVKLTEGVVGRAAILTGDHGVRVSPGSFRRWEPFSVSLWMLTPDIKERAVVFHCSRGWTDAASRGYQLLIEDGKLSASLIHFWPGNAISISTEEPISTDKWHHVTMTYDGSSRVAGLKLFINGQLAQCEVVQDSLTKEIISGEDRPIIIGQRERDRGFTNGIVDSFEVYDRELTQAEVWARFKHQPLEELLHADSLAVLPVDVVKELAILHTDANCRSAREQLQTARQKRDELLDKIKEIMVMRELPQPRETHILDRGVYDARQERVWPGTPAALPPLPEGAPKNRLGLARWLTSPDHPLTARVAVNRYWQLLFGRGLVVTTEDFGSQGSLPTHPDLLDWLAKRFIDSGWDMKQLLKTMVLSNAYRRDSTGVDGSETKDPENIWLSRGPIAPLTAEMIRDSALAVSGLLSQKIGGQPAKPYELAVSFKPMKLDQGEGLYRRSLYTFWKRTAPAPVMLVLDASTRDVCRVRREQTNSPLQAMVLLNGPQYVEAAQGAAAKVLEIMGTEVSARRRLERLFLRLTGRVPTPQELSVLERLYAKQRQAFKANKTLVNKYLSVGEFQEPIDMDRVEVASMAIVAQAVMNLDDCLMKR